MPCQHPESPESLGPNLKTLQAVRGGKLLMFSAGFIFFCKTYWETSTPEGGDVQQINKQLVFFLFLHSNYVPWLLFYLHYVYCFAKTHLATGESATTVLTSEPGLQKNYLCWAQNSTDRSRNQRCQRAGCTGQFSSLWIPCASISQ